MNPIEKAIVLHYHRRRLDLAPLQALGWRDVESQQRRFDVLCQVGDLNGCTVLDLGCGYGDFKPFLDQRYTDFTYLGVDQMAEFLTSAEARYGSLPKTEFVQADFLNAGLPASDYVFCSGALSYRSKSPDYPYALIGQMWRACRRGLAFNLLDANHFAHDYVLCGQDPDAVHAYCRQLSPSAELVSGYLPDDFTILMRR
jgi:SAM-dependent methyltransferase